MTLVAAYAFDEGVGTTAAEVAGGTTLTDIPGWAVGRHGNALHVDNVAGPSLDPFDVDTAFTIMFDLYVDGPGSNAYTVFLNDWENQGDSPFGNVQVTPSGMLDWYLGVGDTGVLIPDEDWVHIALTGDGTWRRAYVDGLLAGQATNSNRSGTGPLRLGGFSGFEPDVRYDNLRIYDTALTAEEIAALAGTPVVPDTEEAFWWWDGAQKQPINLLGWWDGSGIQPATYSLHE